MSIQESETLAAYLLHRDVACPACTYNLRGLATDRCPECHQQLVISVSLAEPPIVQFVLATIGLAACGASFGTWILIMTTTSMVKSGFPPSRLVIIFILVPLAGVVVDVIFVWAFLAARGRRWFGRRDRRGRWAIVAGFWAMSLLTAAAWTIAVAVMV